FGVRADRNAAVLDLERATYFAVDIEIFLAVDVSDDGDGGTDRCALGGRLCCAGCSRRRRCRRKAGIGLGRGTGFVSIPHVNPPLQPGLVAWGTGWRRELVAQELRPIRYSMPHPNQNRAKMFY